jgi:hypothetical protein
MPQLELENAIEITCGMNDHVNELKTCFISGGNIESYSTCSNIIIFGESYTSISSIVNFIYLFF